MSEKSLEERITAIAEKWFLTEPMIFAVYCTHKLLVNNIMTVPIRCGRMRIEYNPNLLNEVTDIVLEEYLKIEVLRIILKHPYSRKPPAPNKIALSVASDITISDNYDAIPQVGLWKAKEFELPINLSYEEYYAKLINEQNLNDYGASKADGTEKIDIDNISLESEEYSNFSDTIKHFVRSYQNAELWDESDEACETINNEIEKAANQANGWGSIPGNLQQVIEASLIIKMDYRKMLNMFRASILSSKRKLTRTKPNRRYDFAFMGSRYDFSTKLLVAVDVSGSITDASLKNFFSIINRFFKYGIESLDVIQFDTEIKGEPMPLKKAKKLVQIIGRGGTSFQPVVEYFEKNPSYDGLIIFTDGYAQPPVPKRSFNRILWVFTNERDCNEARSMVEKLKGSKLTYIPS
ncbi:MAG: VWA-like domain-containing protein [Treponema sp.]|nr:VWA-like domain-containing protein [Treponema sp.]